MAAAKALPVYQAEAKKRQQMGAEMTHQQLGRATNAEMLPPISAEASISDKAKKNREGETLHQAGKAAGVGKTSVISYLRLR